MAVALKVNDLSADLSLPDLEFLSRLADERATEVVLPALQQLAQRSVRFLRQSQEIRAQAENLVAQAEQPRAGRHALAASAVSLQLYERERADERVLMPLLWRLEDLRKRAIDAPPNVRAAWLGAIDPYIEGIRIGFEAIRSARYRLQALDAGANPAAQGLPLSGEELKTFTEATVGYQRVASRIFGRTVNAAIEDVHGERFFVLEVPVDKDDSRPHRKFAAQENALHEEIETLRPDLVGRVVLRYVTRS